jgi:predicted small lipoprotein YifL
MNLSLKNYPLTALIGLCLLAVCLSISMMGCGKKGELVRPAATEDQPAQENEDQPVPQEKQTGKNKIWFGTIEKAA